MATHAEVCKFVARAKTAADAARANITIDIVNVNEFKDGSHDLPCRPTLRTQADEQQAALRPRLSDIINDIYDDVASMLPTNATVDSEMPCDTIGALKARRDECIDKVINMFSTTAADTVASCVDDLQARIIDIVPMVMVELLSSRGTKLKSLKSECEKTCTSLYEMTVDHTHDDDWVGRLQKRIEQAFSSDKRVAQQLSAAVSASCAKIQAELGLAYKELGPARTGHRWQNCALVSLRQWRKH